MKYICIYIFSFNSNLYPLKKVTYECFKQLSYLEYLCCMGLHVIIGAERLEELWLCGNLVQNFQGQATLPHWPVSIQEFHHE